MSTTIKRTGKRSKRFKLRSCFFLLLSSRNELGMDILEITAELPEQSFIKATKLLDKVQKLVMTVSPDEYRRESIPCTLN